MNSVNSAPPQAGPRLADGRFGEKAPAQGPFQTGIDIDMVTRQVPMCPDDVQSLVRRVNSGSMSADEKREAFNRAAKMLNGRQLGALEAGLMNRDDVIALGKAVAQHGSSDVKVDFVKALAPRIKDGDPAGGASAGTAWVENGSREAKVVLDVLNSMGNDPVAFDKAIGALDQKALNNVAVAGTDQRITNGMIPPAYVSHDPTQINAFLDVAAKSRDPNVKARAFGAASVALKNIRSTTSGPANSIGTNDVAKKIVDKMTTLMKTDVRGIVARLEKLDKVGSALTNYSAEMLRGGKSGQIVMGELLAQMQGKGSGLEPFDFIGKTAPGDAGSLVYANAKNLGYFTAAVCNGVDRQNADAKTSGEMIKGIFAAGVSAWGVPGAGAGLVVSKMIDAALERAGTDRNEFAAAIKSAALPVDAEGRRYDGPAEGVFEQEYSFGRAK